MAQGSIRRFGIQRCLDQNLRPVTECASGVGEEVVSGLRVRGHPEWRFAKGAWSLAAAGERGAEATRRPEV